MKDNKFIEINEGISLNDNNQEESSSLIKGKLIFRDGDSGEVIKEEDNLVLMNTRVWLFQQLFGVELPTDYTGVEDNARKVCLFSIGSGGADVNASAFTPFVPRFSDRQLGQSIPFVVVDPDKANNTESQANPSVVTSLSQSQKNKYYMGKDQADGTKVYYAKRFEGATPERPLGNSRGWIIDNSTGKIAFSLSLRIDRTEARGNLFNEIGLWMATYDATNNTFKNEMLATRLCFSTESLESLTKTIDIEYILYI